MCVTLLIILYMKTVDDEIQAFSPQVQCGKSLNITAEQALNDFLQPKNEQQGQMYCFCKNLFNSDLNNGNNAFEP